MPCRNQPLTTWSLHRALQAGEMDNLDFAEMAKNEFGIDGIEYVNQFFKDKAKDPKYLSEMKRRAEGNGVKSLLIMVDGEGGLGDLDEATRLQSVENHYRWVNAAHYLGCHSIRVNARGTGTREEVATAAVDGLGTLSRYASKAGLNVIVENHGGYSSDGQWMSNVLKQVGMDNCGSLPDFGNFCIERGVNAAGDRICVEEYDRYQGVTDLMPYAKAVSAKSHDFDAEGNEVNTDYFRVMHIVKEAGYRGYVGIEYEGSGLSEKDGIRATKALLDRVGQSLA